MPELPEVERSRRLLERVTVGRRIATVTCTRDPIVFDGTSPGRMRRALVGRTVVAAARRGKYLWLELDGRPWPVFHLGMTGDFRTRDEAPLELASSPAREDTASWPPRFTKLHLVVADGGEIVMTNKRRLGRIRLREDPRGESPIRDLGFDPLLDLPSPDRFAELLARRSGVIKSLLLDQSFAAGVGNWIADEVLFQARIDPRRNADDLSPTEARRLRTKLRHVIERAVRVNADKTRFPPRLAVPSSVGPRFHRHHRRRPAHRASPDRGPHDRLGAHPPALALEML